MNAKLLWLKFTIVGLVVLGCMVSLFWGKGLREGIDIRGGHSLIFEIRTNRAERERLEDQKSDLENKLEATDEEEEKKAIRDRLVRVESELKRFEEMGDEPGDLARQMIAVLKKRVDPDGLRSLEWRPLGNTRIEIRMPAGSPESRQRRSVYLQALEKLEGKNIQRGEIRAAERALGGERAAMIERLTLGDPQQKRRFQELTAAYDAMKAAEDARKRTRTERTAALQASTRPANLAQLDEAVNKADAEFDDAQVLYEDKLKELREGNISRARLQGALNNYVSPGEAKVLGPNEIGRRTKIYERQLGELEAQHPARTGEIKEVVRLHREWANIRERLDDPADLQRLIAKAGVLEFRIAPNDIGRGDYPVDPAERTRLMESLQADGPEGVRRRNERFLWFPTRGERKDFRGLVISDYGGKSYVLLHNQPRYTMLHDPGEGGWSLADARAGADEMGAPAVDFTFDEPGARRFARMTSENVGRRMAILLDDEAYSAPVIRTIISKSGQITGKFSVAERDDLVRTLVAGSLPAKLNPDPVSVNTFGPRIGAVNRDMGIRAAKWGLIGVAAFMLIYYLLAGGIADIALLLNLILVLGTMSLIDAVFTLPGIAGVILTIGIAVDANVLIFERLREEQAKGQSIRQALKNAYERALTAILDANVTTLLVCLILGWVGTEEVRGFAITLGLGVGFSLFTSLVVTRWIFQVLLDLRILKNPIFMLKIVGVPKINWMGKRHLFWAVSLLLVVVGIVSLVRQGGDIWGIEFSSGTQATITFRGDALLDGKLLDDAIVRERFKAHAKQLTFEKLEATAMVETQVNPEKVRDFLSEYDDRDDPDDRVSLDEWKSARMDEAFFRKIDSDGDGVLTRDELKNLPPASFQISTTVTELRQIRETAREAFGTSLRIRTKHDFDLVQGAAAPELGVKIPPDGRLPITENLLQSINAAYREEFRDNVGGVLLVVRNVRPVITATELEKRVGEMREQPDFKDQPRSDTTVIGLTSAGEDAFSALAVLVRPSEAALVERPGALDLWAAGEKKLLVDALEREEAMVARNFDAAIAGEAAGRAIFAIIASWLVIVIYLWFRFGSARWGLGAVVCLIHDVIVVVGLVAASGWMCKTWFGEMLGLQSFKIDLAMVAAILTVIGYSVNDTIVVFDRIRENRGKLATVSPQVINASINQTLARTLLTSGTTFIVVVVMYVVGGVGVHAFSYALLAGIVVGTYSSVAVASPLLMGFKQALVAKVTGPAAKGK